MPDSGPGEAGPVCAFPLPPVLWRGLGPDCYLRSRADFLGPVCDEHRRGHRDARHRQIDGPRRSGHHGDQARLAIGHRRIDDVSRNSACAASQGGVEDRGGGGARGERCGFGEGRVVGLKAMGLMPEIISWKLRLCGPTGTAGPTILADVLERYPVIRVADRSA